MNQKTQFDDEAKDYNKSDKRRKSIQKIANEIIRLANFSKQSKVVDFGAGTGLLTFEIQPLVKEIIAIDVSEKMLDEIKKTVIEENINNVKILNFDITKTDCELSDIDVVVSSNIFHHIEDPLTTLKSLFKLMANDGMILIADLEKVSENETPVESNSSRLIQLFEKVGFRKTAFLEIETYSKKKESGEAIYRVFLLSGQK